MRKSRLRRPARLTAIVAACLLGFAAVAAAHEFVSIDGAGTVTITGDGAKKPDLVTIDFDSAKDEYIIGHDILDPIPNRCYRDPDEPVHKLHCPSSVVTSFRIVTLTGSDAVKIGTLLPGAVTVPVHIDTGSGNDQVAGGAEIDTVVTGTGSDKATLGPGDDSVKLGSGSDKANGGAGDDEIKGGPDSDKLRGGKGGDLLLGGADADKLAGGGGKHDHCEGGPGAEKVSGCEAG